MFPKPHLSQAVCLESFDIKLFEPNSYKLLLPTVMAYLHNNYEHPV